MSVVDSGGIFHKDICCYARVLCEMIDGDDLVKDVKWLLDVIRGDERCVLFLRSVVVPSEDKLEVMSDLLSSRSVILKRFVGVLVAMGEARCLEGVLVEFLKNVVAISGDGVVTMVVAHAVDGDIEGLFADVLGKCDRGRCIVIEQVIDEAILGGVVLKDGFFHMDCSVVSYIDRIAEVSVGASLMFSV